jgi:amino acid adenylation domain-containing protein
VLGRDRIGIHDRFFDLGGHSLLATVIITHISQEYGVNLPLRTLFEHPTIAELAQLFEHSRITADPVPLCRADRTGPLPLSPSQERIWFLEQLNPGMTAYTFQSTLWFEGKISPSALESALNDVVGRHEILRTTFHEIDGRRVQVVHERQPISLPVIDLQYASNPEQEAWRLIRAEIRKPFQCEKLPLFYWLLFRLGPDLHLLLHREHHFVHDGWGFNVFLRELFTLYRRHIGEQTPELPELPLQFADFASWQSRWMEGDQAREQLIYWKERLTGAPELLSLPWDHPRPAIPSYRGSAPRIDLPWDICNLLRKKSRENNVTLFMMMFAAFAVLLRRLSGATDICVGSGIANRRWKQTENMLGMIVNNVVLRCDLSGNPSFVHLLRQIKETALDAYAHQDLPYDRMVQSLQPRRDLSFPPVVQVMFSFHDSPVPSLDLPGCKVTLLEGISNGSAKWDMNITLIPRVEQALGNRSELRNEGITLTWEYSTDLFDAGTIDRWMIVFKNLLRTFVDDPWQRIDNVVLNDREAGEIIFQNNRSLAALQMATIHELFERQVQAQSEAIAVISGDKTVTYRDLNKRANQLAHYLRKLGVGPEVYIGICVERGIEMVLGILGILKAGAAYVPLDPNYPRERLAYLMRDADMPALLTQRNLLAALAGCKAQVILLDGDGFSEEQDGNPGCTSSFDNVAYVIYTSGSTGAPKGVEVTHGNVVRLFQQTQADFQFTSQDAWPLFHSYAFDFSVWELWGALLYGGRLVVVPLWVARSSEEFLDLLLQHRVTILNQTPSAFQQLSHTVEARPELANELASLRLIIFGGEALEFQSLKQWIDRYGVERPRLINMYGITETTVHVTCCPVTRSAMDEKAVGSRIGIPIPDLDAYVLDANMQRAPVGMAGEIYVGGAGLARGYLNRPALTAERFLPDPFNSMPGSRLYRSGDLARQRADGTLEYLGRMDDQVKICGYRIELGEIEAALNEYPTVRESAVVAREPAQHSERQLVGYVVMRPEETVTMEELREHLEARLPDYMVPQQFVILEKLPLTSNGKLDRKALPDPGTAGIRPQQAFVAPSTPVEESLAAICAEVLRVNPIGIHDNFFDLGGHSLLAMQLLSQIQALYGVKLPLRTIFEQGTIAQLAEILQGTLLERVAGLSDQEAQHLLDHTELGSEVRREG